MIVLTISRLLRQVAAMYPEKIGVIADDFTLSWGEIDRKVDARCYYFLQKGITAGRRIGVWSINSGEYLLTLLALCRIGAVPVLLNTALSDEELISLCDRVEIDFLIYGEGYKGCLFAGTLNQVNCRSGNLNLLSMANISDEADQYLHRPPFVDFARPNSTALIMCTSGSTQLPKAVQLSHYSLVNNAKAMVDAMQWGKDDLVCVTVPFFHCFGLTGCILTALHTGMTLVVLPRFRSVPAFAKIQSYKCTVLNGVPSMYLSMYANPARRDYDLSSVRSGIIAGSPIYPQDFIKVKSMFADGCAIQPSYGQTETSPCCTIVPRCNGKVATADNVGVPIDGVEMRIVDNDGYPVTRGESGKIQVRGYNVMQGYYNQPEETLAAFTADGWLDTGDLGEFDQDGNLVMTGRSKTIIIRGGENISPVEIEKAISALPGIAAVSVFGVPDPILQEEICACIVPQKTANYTAEIIRADLVEHLAGYKIPKYILFFDEFPCLASGKVDLKKIHRQAQERLAAVNKS